MRKTIPTLGIVSAGLLLAGSPAHAVETDMSSNLNIGVANGIQALLPIQAPVNLCGNAIGLLGSANSYCVGGANADYASPVNNPVYNPYLFAQGGGYGQNLPIPLYPLYPAGGGGGGVDTDLQSALNGGIANGIQADAKIQAPINLCGNAIGILGSANSFCTDGAAANLFSNSGAGQALPIILPPARNTARTPHKPAPAKHTAAKPTAKPTAAKPTAAKPAVRPMAKPAAVKSSPNKRGVAAKPGKKTEGGLLANLLAPVTGLLTGGGLGGGFAGDRCGGDVDMGTFGNIGAANGIQAHAPIQAPINLTGNAIGLLGSASGIGTAGASANYCS